MKKYGKRMIVLFIAISIIVLNLTACSIKKNSSNDVKESDNIDNSSSVNSNNKKDLELKVTQIDSNDFPNIKLYILAKDSQGNIVKNLVKSDILIKENNKANVKIEKVNYVNKAEPVNIEMIMDTSGSMADNDVLNTCKDIANKFLNIVDFKNNDKVGLIDFNDISRVDNYFTNNKNSLMNSINGLTPNGETAFYDSLIDGLKQTNLQEGPKYIIAFTDGLDNKSKFTPKDVVDLSLKLNIPIYIVGLGDETSNDILKNISDKTGGEFFKLKDVNELNDVYKNILKKTKDETVVEYVSDLNKKSSDSVKLDLNLVGNNYTGNTEFSYIPKPNNYVVNIKGYNRLKESIKDSTVNKFSNVKGNYSLAFEDLSLGNPLILNDEKTNAASIIKIFIMIDAFNQVKNGNISLDQTLTLEDNMKVGGSGVLQHSKEGTTYTVEKLINLMMSKSDNVAANMLIDLLGINNINDEIKALGCNNTELNRKLMDKKSLDEGIDNYTSVGDLSLIFNKLYDNQCLGKDYDEQMLDLMLNQQLKTKIPKELPKGTKIAHKSGEFTGIQNDCGIIYTPNGAYFLAVMTKDGESKQQINAIADLSKQIFDKFNKFKN